MAFIKGKFFAQFEKTQDNLSANPFNVFTGLPDS